MLRALFPLVLLPAALNAQTLVDIRLRHTSPTETHVVLVPQNDHHGVFSSVAFTLRWPADGSVEILTVQADPGCGATVSPSARLPKRLKRSSICAESSSGEAAYSRCRAVAESLIASKASVRIGASATHCQIYSYPFCQPR